MRKPDCRDRVTKTLLRSGKVLGNRVCEGAAEGEAGPEDLLFNVEGEPSPMEPPPFEEFFDAP